MTAKQRKKRARIFTILLLTLLIISLTSIAVEAQFNLFNLLNQPPKGGCIDECKEGLQECTFQSGVYRTCADHDEDGCMEWKDFECKKGEDCSDGQCVKKGQQTGCQNDFGCSKEGVTKCTGTTSYTKCGNYDADSCLEWFANPDNCKTGQVCSGGQCVASCTDTCSTQDSPKCSGDDVLTCGNYDADSCLEWGTSKTCSSGQSCQSGVCVSPVASCTSSKDCPATDFCTQAECKTRFGLGQLCTYHDQCGLGESCKNGVCDQEGATDKGEGDYCIKAIECLSGECVNSFCTAPPAQACKSSKDCPKGQECVNKFCEVPQASECSSSKNCTATDYCANGACKTRLSLGETCSYHDQCYLGDSCKNGVCDQEGATDKGAGEYCIKSIECLSGECVDSFCTVPPLGGKGAQCTSNTQCQTGLNCQKGTCQLTGGAAGSICTQNTDCQTGLSCQQNICLTAPTLKTYDEPCTTNSECSSNRCVDFG